jgi:hypothetical protein
MVFSLVAQGGMALFLLFLLVYCPGRLFLRALRLSPAPLERAVLSLAGGFALLTFLYWFLAVRQWGAFLPVAGVVFGAAEWFCLRRDRARPAPAADPAWTSAPLPGWPFWLIAVSAVLLQSRMIVTSGRLIEEGLILFNTHAADAPTHIYTLEELSRTFPAAAPGFAGLPLRNYHFFFNLFWAALIRLGSLDPWDVYFRLSPVFASLLLSLASYTAASAWARSRTAGYAAAAMSGLFSNFGILAALFSRSALPIGWGGILWVSPPPECILNPPGFLSYAIVLCGWQPLTSWVRHRNARGLLLVGLIWGVLPGLKMYAAVTLLIGLLAGGGWEALFQRRFRLWTAAALLLPLYLFQARMLTPTAGGMAVFFPGFNLAAMLTEGRMNALGIADLIALYGRHPLLAALLIGLMIPVFALGNLGVRILGLRDVWRAFIHPRTGDPLLFLILAAGGAALCAAVLFIQAGAHQWNTIQFYYYAVLLGGLPAAAAFARWADAARPRAAAAGWILLFAAGAGPFLNDLVRSEMVTQAVVLPRPLVETCQWIRAETPPGSVILCPLPEGLTGDGYHSWEGLRKRTALRTREDWRRYMSDPKTESPAPGPLPETRRGRVTLTILERWDATLIAALTTRPTYLEHPLLTLVRDPAAPVDDRVRRVTAFYADPAAAASRGFLEKEQIDWVLMPSGIPGPPPPATLAFSRGDVRLFDVRPLRVRSPIPHQALP